MTIGVLQSTLFADMFGTAAMREAFGDLAFLRNCTIVEAALARAQARLGIVPKEAKVAALEGMHWVADAHYMCVPKGVSDEKLGVLLDLMSYLLAAKSQAFAYDKGYFYPGPAVKDVPLSMAPEDSQEVIKEFGRPEYADLIASHPQELPLSPDKLVYAFSRWDKEVGAAK